MAAIVAMYVVAQSGKTGRGEEGTLSRLLACGGIIENVAAESRACIFNTAGDASMTECPGAVSAIPGGRRPEAQPVPQRFPAPVSTDDVPGRRDAYGYGYG